MKRHEIEASVNPHVAEISEICEAHGAPFGRCVCDGSLNKAQRAAGDVARIYVILADEAPGWRSKDRNANRGKLKRAIKEALTAHGLQFAVHVQAHYSCLTVEDGMAVRRDNAGRAIGAHQL